MADGVLEEGAQAPFRQEFPGPVAGIPVKVGLTRRSRGQGGQGKVRRQFGAAEAGMDALTGEGIEEAGGIADQERARRREARGAMGKGAKAPGRSNRPGPDEAISQAGQERARFRQEACRVSRGLEVPAVDDQTHIGQIGSDRIEDAASSPPEKDLADLSPRLTRAK
jgi:hypothetical protein